MNGLILPQCSNASRVWNSLNPGLASPTVWSLGVTHEVIRRGGKESKIISEKTYQTTIVAYKRAVVG